MQHSLVSRPILSTTSLMYKYILHKLQLCVLVYRQMRPMPLPLSCIASRGRDRLLKEMQKGALVHLSHSKLMKRMVQWRRAQRKGEACLLKVKRVLALVPLLVVMPQTLPAGSLAGQHANTVSSCFYFPLCENPSSSWLFHLLCRLAINMSSLYCVCFFPTLKVLCGFAILL